MLDIVHHLVFTANLAVVTAVLVWAMARSGYVPRLHRSAFYLFTGAVVIVNVLFVLLFVSFLPDWITTTDGERYMYEIRGIAAAPREWNPFTGEGSRYYEVTPKMGMSYLYGVILFLHQIDSLYAVLALNIVFSLLTSLTVFALTRLLHPAVLPALLAMLASAVYPEMLFWTGRVVRENVTLFLVPLLVLASIRFHDTRQARYVLVVVATCVALFLVRIQLVFFAFLIVAFYAVVGLRSAARWKAMLATVAGVAGLVVAFGWIETQMRRAVGGSLLDFFSLNPAFYAEQAVLMVQNLGSVITPVARGSYGALGLLIAPAVAAVLGLFVLALVRRRVIFGEQAQVAGLLIFLSATFMLLLAASGVINIRFRSTVAPLLIPLVSVTAVHYWRTFRLPAVRLAPHGIGRRQVEAHARLAATEAGTS